MKKNLSLFILAAVVFNLTGVFITFKIEQSHLRKLFKNQLLEGIPNADLHTFCFSQKELSELDWTRQNKEFNRDGKMYDVVRIENLNDSIHIYCVNDEEEELLFAKLDSMIKKQMERESNSTKNPLCKVAKTIKLVYVTQKFTYPLPTISTLFELNFPDLNLFYSSPFIGNLAHPPDIIT